MLEVNDYINLGIFPSKAGVPSPIKWIVLQVDGTKAKLMSKNAIIGIGSQDFQEPTWKESKLRERLNTEIYNLIFSNEEKVCVFESITVDDERLIKEFYWDEKYCEDDIGVAKCQPIMTRDYIFLPSMHDMFDYIYTSPESARKNYYETRKYKLKSEEYSLEETHHMDFQYPTEIVYPLMNAIYDGFDNIPDRPANFKRHVSLNSRCTKPIMGINRVRMCVWIDLEKYEGLKDKCL